MRIFLRILIVVLLTAAASPAWSEGSVTVGIGGNFFLADQAYLDALSVGIERKLSERMELHLGGDFGINTANRDGEGNPVPSLLVPVTLGLNFTFPVKILTFALGTGVSPVFNFNPKTDNVFRFYMGPYARGVVRFQVHPVMSLFVSFQQDLQIGGEDWINTSTRVLGGIHFSINKNQPHS